MLIFLSCCGSVCRPPQTYLVSSVWIVRIWPPLAPRAKIVEIMDPYTWAGGLSSTLSGELLECVKQRVAPSLIGVVGLFESIHIGWVLVKSLFPRSDHPAAIVRCSFVQVIS